MTGEKDKIESSAVQAARDTDVVGAGVGGALVDSRSIDVVSTGIGGVKGLSPAGRPLVAIQDSTMQWRPSTLAALESVLARLPSEFGAVVACRPGVGEDEAPGEIDVETLGRLIGRTDCASLIRREALERDAVVRDRFLALSAESRGYLLPDSQVDDGKDVSDTRLSGVSVVIPAYNYAHFLPEAIDSALGQDYPNLEVIVVDDGSTDATPDVVAGYGDRIRCIRKKNAGLSAARNTGIEAATHPFVAFLDADDAWLPGMISTIMREFARHGDDLGVVAGQSIFMNHDGEIVPFKSRVADLPKEITFADILLKTRFSPSSVVARKSVFAECGPFDTTMRSSEDRDMWLRIAAKHKVVLLRDRLLYVRNHPSSMSKNTDRMKANMRTTFRKAFALRVPGGRGPFVRMKVAAFFHFQIAWMYFDEGRRPAALKECFFSAMMWPWFSKPAALNEPPLFRLRTLKTILFGWSANKHDEPR